MKVCGDAARDKARGRWERDQEGPTEEKRDANVSQAASSNHMQ